MNIGLFTDSYDPLVDGTATVVRTLARGLQRAGHVVSIVTAQHPDAVPEKNVVRVPSVPLPIEPQYRLSLPLAPPALKHQMEDLDLDIIHSHTPGPLGLLALHLAASTSVPIIYTSHTMYEDRLHLLPLGRRMARRHLGTVSRRFADRHTAVVAPSRKMMLTLDRYGVSVPTHLVPNGIPLDAFMNHPEPGEVREFRRCNRIADDERLVTYVGRISREKALDVLLRNFARVASVAPYARLLLAGDGPERGALMKLARDLGVDARVVFTGYLAWPQQVSLALHASHVFASASRSEVHPVSFLEALATGTPVVALRDPSTDDIVTDGEGGFLFEDEARLHEGILRLLLMAPKGYRELLDSSLSRARCFSSDVFVERMIELYEHYAAGNGVAADARNAHPAIVGAAE